MSHTEMNFILTWQLCNSYNGSAGKESTCNPGEPGSISGSGRSPGAGHGNPLQHSCLENAMDRGTWQATVHGVAKSQTQLKQLSMHAHHLVHIYLITVSLYILTAFIQFLLLLPQWRTWASLVAQRLKHLPAMQESWVRSLSWEDPLAEGNGNPLQYSCLENPMGRGAWWAILHGVAKSRTRLSDFTFFQIILNYRS